jgi:hypothetical protein
MGIAAARVFRIRVPPSTWLPFSAATLYLFGIVLVYLGTPYELSWHLATSSGRTVLPIFVTFSIATFLVMDAIEDAPAREEARGVSDT